MSGLSFKDFVKQASSSQAGEVTRAKLKFSRQIKRLMRRRGVSNKEMALKMKCTSANISKLINSEGNLRLETMVKLARAAGGEFSFEVGEKKIVSDASERTDYSQSVKFSQSLYSDFKLNDGGSGVVSFSVPSSSDSSLDDPQSSAYVAA